MRIDGPQVTSSLSLNGTTITDLNVFVTTGSLNGITGSYATTGSLNSFTSSANSRLNSIEGVSGSYATTGSNVFVGTQTSSGSIVPSVNNTYDLGSPTHQFRHVYISSGSLYVNGTKVLGSTAQELQITTDGGQSFKILESGSDTITLQSVDGNVTLTSSGQGDIVLDPTTGIIGLKGTVTVYTGNKITSSDGNSIQFGNGIAVTGSIVSTVTPLVSGSSQVLNGSGVWSGSAQLPSGIISGSPQLPSGLISSSVQVTGYGFATTGSNAFIGTQVISGSILQSGSFTTTGTIIAQTINVQSVTSSVVYSSGSNVFGNDIGNSQVFTGSVLITGSLTISGASSASSYSGTTIYGSTAVCSAVGYFSGCVGIGISSPAEKIHVLGSSGATSPRIRIQSHDTANATAGLSLYGRDASNDNKVSEIVTAGCDLTISVNSAERMRITSCGNVVIGNTTAYGGLTVSEFTTNDCNDSISLFYRGTSGGHESLIKFYDFRCQLNASIGNNLHDDTPSGQKARLVFKTSNNGAPTERMRIDACGKVGIGINSPCSILHIVDTSANATTLTIGESGEVPTIKAGGTNTDLRIEAVGGGGFLEFATNSTVRIRTYSTGETCFACQICTPGISITSNPIGVEYLIIAGGGGGGWDVGGGGGAGGVLNDSTGIWPGTYNIGIGGGGAGAVTGAPTMPNNGFNTYAIGLMAIGGGGGGNYGGGWGSGGGSGGGGAGYGATTNAGFGMKGQGFEGGCGLPVAGLNSTGGAGGGAGAAGASSINNLTGCVAGGTGIISTIIGEHRSYGCGGRGGGDSWSGNQAGRTNTGDGGDGAGIANSVNNGSNGGSGLTILKMRNTNSATFSVGLTTYTCTHLCGYNIYVVTAGSGTLTIS